MPNRHPSPRKIQRKKSKGLYYNPKNMEFETLDEQSRRLYNKGVPKNPDVIVNEGKPNQKGMSNKEYMAEYGAGAVVDSYKSKGPLRNRKSKRKIR